MKGPKPVTRTDCGVGHVGASQCFLCKQVDNSIDARMYHSVASKTALDGFSA